MKNKIAVVTGAGQGIGAGIAKMFAQERCNVVVSDISIDSAKRTVAKIEEFKVKTLAVKCDVSNGEDVENMVKEVKESFGKIDIVVNNAGIYPFKPFSDISEDDWDKVMDVNLKGTFLISKECLKLMSDGGRIINISSIASILGMNSLSTYCASKSGINGLTRSLAVELASRNITVNAIAPGAIDTPGASSPDEVKKQTIAGIPLKRMGTPEDIANAVIFLASDRSSYITGQVIVVDGGWSVL